MGRRIREFDWRSHPLGDAHYWPPALQMAMSLCLNSTFPTAVYWGPEHYVLYNDAWAFIPAERHPAALGRKGAELWSDIWAEVGPEFAKVFDDGIGVREAHRGLALQLDVLDEFIGVEDLAELAGF